MSRRFAPLRGFWPAWSFLTRVPTPGAASVEPDEVARATRWYPVVGGAVGLVQLAALSAGTFAVSPAFGAILAVAAGEWFTRGLHLDGVADCLDGLLVNGDRDRCLSVMKDPHVGGLGAAGVAIWVLLRVAAVLAAAEHDLAAPALVGGAVLARSVIAWDVVAYPPASASGLYASLRGQIRPSDAGIAGFFGVMAAAWLLWASPVRGAIALAASVLLPLVWNRVWVKKLGGINGDVVGAAVQVRELCVWAGV